MKNLIVYANEAFMQVALVDIAEGVVNRTKKITVKEEFNKESLDIIKGITSNSKDAFNIVSSRGLILPVLEAMKIWNYLVYEKFDIENEDETQAYQQYVLKAEKAGIDTDAIIGCTDIDKLKALALACMTNDWTNRESLDYMLTLALTGKHKFRNIDTLIDEPRNQHMSATEERLRDIVGKMKENCKLPELKTVEVNLDTLLGVEEKKAPANKSKKVVNEK